MGGSITGLQQTVWINWFAVISLLIIIPARRIFNPTRITRMKMTPNDLIKIAIVGVLYPLFFSVTYFESARLGSPTFLAVSRAFVPIMYIGIAFILFRKRGFSVRDGVFLLVSILLTYYMTGGTNGIQNNTLAGPALALTSAFAFSLYLAIGESWRNKYDPVVVTLVGEVVTAILSTVLLVLFDHPTIPSSQTLLYLFLIGALASGVGFWLQLSGFQIASAFSSVSHKVFFLATQRGLTIILQALVIAISGVELTSNNMWVGAIGIAISSFLYLYLDGLAKRTKATN